MSDLFSLLADIRTNYVGQFEQALRDLREQGRTVMIEPPMLDDQGELAREGVLNLGARYDLAVVEGESASPSMFSPGRMLQFEPIAFQGGGLHIVIAPFSWDGARIAIDGDPPAIAAAPQESTAPPAGPVTPAPSLPGNVVLSWDDPDATKHTVVRAGKRVGATAGNPTDSRLAFV